MYSDRVIVLLEYITFVVKKLEIKIFWYILLLNDFRIEI